MITSYCNSLKFYLLFLFCLQSSVVITADESNTNTDPNKILDKASISNKKEQNVGNNSKTDGKIGIKLLVRHGFFYIQDISLGSPAELAGLETGDRILKIDNKSVDNMSLSDATALVSGLVDSNVSFLVRTKKLVEKNITVTRKLESSFKKKNRTQTLVEQIKYATNTKNSDSAIQLFYDIKAKKDEFLLKQALLIFFPYIVKNPDKNMKFDIESTFNELIEKHPHFEELADIAKLIYFNDDLDSLNELKSISGKVIVTLSKYPSNNLFAKNALSKWLFLEFEIAEKNLDSSTAISKLKESLFSQPGITFSANDFHGKAIWDSNYYDKRNNTMNLVGKLFANSSIVEAENFLKGSYVWSDYNELQKIMDNYSKEVASFKNVAGKKIGGKEWFIEPPKAPDLTLNIANTVNSIDGKNIKLSDLSGKVVMVLLWATWCAPCHQELAAFQTLYKKLEGKNFEILAVSVDQDKEKVLPFLEKKGITFPAGFALQKDPIYRTKNVPISYLIDSQGRIVSSHVGYSDKSFQEISLQIEKMLSSGYENTATPLVIDSYNIAGLEMKGYYPMPRVSDIIVNKDSNKDSIFALSANGEFSKLYQKPDLDKKITTADKVAPETEDRITGDFNGINLIRNLVSNSVSGFDRVLMLDADDDSNYEQLFYKQGDKFFSVESVDKKKSFWVGVVENGISSIVIADISNDGKDDVVVLDRGSGLSVYRSNGEYLWSYINPLVTSFSVKKNQKTTSLLVSSQNLTLKELSSEGKEINSIDLFYTTEKIWSLAVNNTSRNSYSNILFRGLRSVQQVLSVDLEGDGFLEYAVVLPKGLLLILDQKGELLHKLSFPSNNIRVVKGRFFTNKFDEIAVALDGLGVVVFSKKIL